MTNWKTQLVDILTGLARTHAAEPLREVQRILRGILHLEDISFQDHAGRELRAETPLQQAIEQIAQAVVRLPVRPAAGAAKTNSAPRPVESRFRRGPGPAANSVDSEQRYDAFVREFLRLQEKHEFMWAGYVVRELLPRLGFAPEEAKLVLDHLRAENIVTITKVPNSRNPEFPATSVQLNPDHPRVKAILAEKAAGESQTADVAGTRSADPGDVPVAAAAAERKTTT
jgi:hypothetical protein